MKHKIKFAPLQLLTLVGLNCPLIAQPPDSTRFRDRSEHPPSYEFLAANNALANLNHEDNAKFLPLSFQVSGTYYLHMEGTETTSLTPSQEKLTKLAQKILKAQSMQNHDHVQPLEGTSPLVAEDHRLQGRQDSIEMKYKQYARESFLISSEGFDLKQRVGFLRQLASGIDHLHQNELYLEGRISHAIVLEEADSEPKAVLTAWLNGSKYSDENIALAGFDTFHYHAPESMLHNLNFTGAQGDVFTFGMFIFDLFTGSENPFLKNMNAFYCMSCVTGRMEGFTYGGHLTSAPEEIKEIIDGSTVVEPEKRWSLSQVIAKLSELYESL